MQQLLTPVLAGRRAPGWLPQALLGAAVVILVTALHLASLPPGPQTALNMLKLVLVATALPPASLVLIQRVGHWLERRRLASMPPWELVLMKEREVLEGSGKAWCACHPMLMTPCGLCPYQRVPAPDVPSGTLQPLPVHGHNASVMTGPVCAWHRTHKQLLPRLASRVDAAEEVPDTAAAFTATAKVHEISIIIFTRS